MTMRFMVMHKNDKHTEAGERPGPELIARMGEFIGEYARKGQFLGGEGLGASATRTRLTFAGGQCTVKHGPYAGANELPAATLLLKVESRDQAIGWAQRYGKILVDGEIELGPVTEAWDLGLMPRPADAPLRVLMLVKAHPTSGAGQALSPKQKADLTRLKTEMTKAGVLVSAETLEPSARSKRLTFTNHKLIVMDGPFSESKELIGGFAMLALPSVDAAIELCTRYAAILGGTLEIDVRPLDEGEAAT
jgi:hypothetical protein